MKNRLNIAERCLYFMSFISFVGVVFSFINYGMLKSASHGFVGQDVSFFSTVLVPSALGILFGLAFHYCAKFIKLGDAQVWKVTTGLVSLFAVRSLYVFLFDHWLMGAVGLALPSVTLWALLQKGSRAYVRNEKGNG
jgi:hypothetical protein